MDKDQRFEVLVYIITCSIACARKFKLDFDEAVKQAKKEI